MIRVLLADDHKIVRDGLRSLLCDQDDLEVVGEAEDGAEALELANRLRPDVIVMDIGMPGINGIEATRRIRSEVEGTLVVILSMHAEKRFVIEVLRAGASGYVLKDGAFEELSNAIREVVRDGSYLSPRIARIVVNGFVQGLEVGSAQKGVAPRLSPREREVLQLTAEGLATKEIAARLGLSIKTVETHRRQLMDKLGIYNLAGLVKFAIREGLASLD